MIRFVDAPRDRFGVGQMCRELQAAPSTYYAARGRSPSARQVRDDALKVKIQHVYVEHFGVYGVRKLWRQLRREGIPVARCTVERLMVSWGSTVRYVGRPVGPRYLEIWPRDHRTWWSGTSGRHHPTGCG